MSASIATAAHRQMFAADREFSAIPMKFPINVEPKAATGVVKSSRGSAIALGHNDHHHRTVMPITGPWSMTSHSRSFLPDPSS